MPIALALGAERLDDLTRERLRMLGFAADAVAGGDAVDAAVAALDAASTAPSLTDSPDLGVLAAGVRAARDADALAVVVHRGSDTLMWRRDAARLLGEASAQSSEVSHPLVLIVVPATIAPRPGPVVVISPAEGASSYELYVAAALAAATGRRVEHLTGRGSRGSITYGAAPARATARTAVNDWRERAADRPERAVHTLAVRPAIIVAAVPPGSADAAALVADHPDADIVLVLDAVHARLGATSAARVAVLVETALGVQLDLDASGDNSDGADAFAESTPIASDAAAIPPVGDLPALIASDVLHVRLTDIAVEATNWTRLRARVRVALGARTDPGHALAELDMLLEPGDARRIPTSDLSAITALTPPEAVLRHWSHEDAEVYEGGERCLAQVTVSVLDDAGTERATKAYPVPNGLDFSLISRDLSALLGRTSTTPALPDPIRRGAAAASHDLLAELESALAVGRTLLARAAR